MTIRVKNELLLINILVVLLIVIITVLPSDILRIVLGLPFVLFFPGYTLIAALFPRKRDLDGIERVALSFGLSIAVVPLIGLILNYTPWGIRLYPVLASTALFIFAMSVVAWVRRNRLTPEERFIISFNVRLSNWGGSSGLDKMLTVILAVAITAAIGTLIYVIATPKVGEKFSEFYVLGLEGKAVDYPKELVVGEEGKVIVGIVNRQQETTSYTVEITVDGVKNKEIGPVLLAHEEKWEQEVSFTPVNTGENQKVEFLLYKNKTGQSEPHLSLHLWVDVKEAKKTEQLR